MKILTYITNYEGNSKLKYLKNIILNLEKIPSTQHDVIIYSIENLNLKSDKLNIQISIHPKEFSNSIYKTNWQKEPEFIWLHRKDLISKVNKYDLYLHLEDDILFTLDNFNYYIKHSKLLKQNEIPGFLVYEEINNVKKIVSMHKGFNNNKHIQVKNKNYFIPSNLHAASYIIDNDRLNYIIKKGFNSQPKIYNVYNIKCTACVEPYLFLNKNISIFDLDNSLLKHLTNKYFNKKNNFESITTTTLKQLLNV